MGMSRNSAMRRDLARHVRLERGGVQEQHVRQVPKVPPGPDVVPKRPERMSVPVQPGRGSTRRMGGRRRFDRRGRRGPACRSGAFVEGPVRVGVVVVHAPDHVATVASYIDVAVRRAHEGVDRQWVLRNRRCGCASTAAASPPSAARGGRATATCRRPSGPVTAEEELRDDLLHPGRPRLRVGRR